MDGCVCLSLCVLTRRVLQCWQNMNDTSNPTLRNDPNTPRSGFGSNPIWARWARHALEDVIHVRISKCYHCMPMGSFACAFVWTHLP